MGTSTCHRVGPLTARKRANLPASAFGLPERHKYPIPDPKHAAAAKGRALQQLERGNLSERDYLRIVQRADAVIARCRGGSLAGRSEEDWFVDNARWLLPLFGAMAVLTLGVALGRKSCPAGGAQ